MANADYLQGLLLVIPEAILTLTALGVLGVDLLALRGRPPANRRAILVGVSLVGCFAVMGWLWAMHRRGEIGGGLVVVDSVTQWAKIGILCLTAFTVAISIQTETTPHLGEYYALILIATVGMMFMVSAGHLLSIFLSLETLSLCLYILVAFDKRNPRGTEAAFKYFLFGGTATGFALFGLSLIYGASGGAMALRDVASQLAQGGQDPVLWLGLWMALAGFGFKIAAVPFHLWAPDTYQVAPVPVAALVAAGSKLASFVLLARFLMIGFGTVSGGAGSGEPRLGWVPVVAVLAVTSIVFGNLIAVAQSSVRRLLAYSAIAHAGYALVGISANSPHGLVAVMYYVFTYGLTLVGAFGVVNVVEKRRGSDRMSDFAGLSREAPIVSICMLVFLLSLAGIPPLAGFFGKFYLFAAALRGGTGSFHLLWLVVVGLAMSAFSLYYYLQVLKQIYVVDAEGVRPGVSGGKWITLGPMVALAVLVLVFGCMPELIVGRLTAAVGLP